MTSKARTEQYQKQKSASYQKYPKIHCVTRNSGVLYAWAWMNHAKLHEKKNSHYTLTIPQKPQQFAKRKTKPQSYDLFVNQSKFGILDN